MIESPMIPHQDHVTKTGAPFLNLFVKNKLYLSKFGLLMKKKKSPISFFPFPPLHYVVGGGKEKGGGKGKGTYPQRVPKNKKR